MESIQEAYLLLNIPDDTLKSLPLFQRYALILHALALKRGFLCTGFLEDDPKQQDGILSRVGIVALAEDWPLQNADVVSFRYTHPTEATKPDSEEFYVKMIPGGEGRLEVNALSSVRNDDIYSMELKMEDLKEDAFYNLDAWVPKTVLPQFEREIIQIQVEKYH